MNERSVSIRPARREDVAAMIAMLADDQLGRARERLEDPLPEVYYEAFERVERSPNLLLVVAESDGRVVGCLQLALLPGISSQGGIRGLLEDVALPLIAAAAASAKSWCNGLLPKPRRAAAIWSNCSRIRAASMRSASTSGLDFRRVMSA